VSSFEITHHGAVDGVTGSCHQLFVGSGEGDTRDSILIDCGLFQGGGACYGSFWTRSVKDRFSCWEYKSRDGVSH